MRRRDVRLISWMMAASVVVLPEPVGLRYEHEPARQLRQLLQRLWKLEVVERGNVCRDDPEHRSDAVLLGEDVHAKAGASLEVVSEVDLAIAFERDALLVVHDLPEEAARLFFGERAKRQGDEVAVVANDRHVAGVEMQIARLLVEDESQEGVDSRHGSPTLRHWNA